MIFVFILDSTSFVFVDESGFRSYYCRIMARAKRGVKIHATRPGKKSKLTNIVARLLYQNEHKKHIAVQCYNHSTKSGFFEDWFEWQLLAEVPEGAVIIMDNASFHRKNQLYKIAERYGVHIVFLPPYSPEFNKIECSFAAAKKWLKYNLNRFPNIEMALEYYFCY